MGTLKEAKRMGNAHESMLRDIIFLLLLQDNGLLPEKDSVI